jgi:hypothetical protein
MGFGDEFDALNQPPAVTTGRPSQVLVCEPRASCPSSPYRGFADEVHPSDREMRSTASMRAFIFFW